MSTTDPATSKRARRCGGAGGIALAVLGVAGLAAVGVYLGNLSSGGAGEPEPVALVNGRPISEAYVQQRIESLPLGSQIEVRENRIRFIETLVTEEALLQSVLANDFRDLPALRERVKEVVAGHLIEAEVRGRIRVTDEQVRAYYDANEPIIRGETVEIRHIQLGEREECEALLPRIRTLDDFERLARERSQDSQSAVRGGVLGRVMDHDAYLGFEQAAFAMSEGELRVFESERGCHVVRAGARERPPLPPLEAVAGRIRSLLARQQEIALLRELVARIEQRVPVERSYRRP